ncbi:MAG TPA: biotin--[acetyl-CoA-carboxylase] ligase [Gemmatales bacterium]|nr:biotin--[acetyl-CoA-carboxylase] ligase [Gemmatales bacterium]HMP61201.1 biotin--[acetyl-CoA-carboxylase] ligase [Gemmatales bacterium]
MTEKELGLPRPFVLVRRQQIESTNSVAKELALLGCAPFTLVLAEEQTAGRGRYGRSWVSPPGNLYASVVLRPGPNWPALETLAFVASVALGRTLRRWLAPERIRYKWPNDVLVDGAKIAGVLLEASLAREPERGPWLIVGMGLNLVEAPKVSVYPTTSLAAVLGRPISVAEAVTALASDFLAALELWRTEGFDPVRAEFCASAKGWDEPIHVRLAQRTFSGIMRAIDRTGRLVVEQGGQLEHVSSGEVFFGSTDEASPPPAT